MEVTMEQRGDTIVVTPAGRHLDASNAKQFKEKMIAALATHTKIVCDMSQLDFVDSSGLGALVSCLRQLRATGGDLKLCGMTEPVRVLFELVRMDRIFAIYPTRDKALRTLSADYSPEAADKTEASV